MRKLKQIEFNGKELTVKELTVTEITKLMDGLNNFEPHILDIVMDQPIQATAFFLSTGLTMDNLDDSICPSDLIPVYEKVIEVNPTYAATIERLKQAGMQAMKSGKLPAG